MRLCRFSERAGQNVMLNVSLSSKLLYLLTRAPDCHYGIIDSSVPGKDEVVINLIASDNKFSTVIAPYLKTRI